MQTLFEIFEKRLRQAKPLKATQGLIGIEIETEVPDYEAYKSCKVKAGLDSETGHPIWTIPSDSPWKGVYDGSLRNYGVEWVLKEPLSYEAALDSLDWFGKYFKDVPFLENQPGTSVHVHINMQNETLLVMANFITMVQLFENVLTEISGKSRRSNVFALPTRCADENRTNILKLFAGIDDGDDKAILFQESQSKYAVLNIATLAKYGSLEIRCFRGTTDVSAIKQWVSILNRIYEFARTPGLTPRGLYKDYQQRELEVIDDVFGPFAEDFKVPGYHALINRAEFDAFKIATSIRDWYSFGGIYEAKDKVDKLKKKKTVDMVYVDNAAPNHNLWGTSPASLASILQGVPATTFTVIEEEDDGMPIPDWEDQENEEDDFV